MFDQEPEVGDTLTYSPFGGGIRIIQVTEVDEDIKNGRAGFSGVDKDGNNWWGYNSQIIVIAKSKSIA